MLRASALYVESSKKKLAIHTCGMVRFCYYFQVSIAYNAAILDGAHSWCSPQCSSGPVLPAYGITLSIENYH